MASPNDLPEYLRVDLTQECKGIIASLPSKRAWLYGEIHLFQGFWYPTWAMDGVLSFQKYFLARDSDLLLASFPKTGTTWMKALIFALMNRGRFMNSEKHPLLLSNSHSLVPNMELDVYGGKANPDLSGYESPRIFSTHMPFLSLPDSAKESDCKIVYIGRNPKDTLISFWQVTNKLKREGMEKMSVEAAFDRFCKGEIIFGPVWEHELSYWNESLERPDKILFLKYEELKENPVIHTRKLAEFLGCPFSVKEDRESVVDDIIKLCSFENLSQLEVNRNGKSRNGDGNNLFYRKGNVGDWKNYLSPEMAEQIDIITEEKLSGSGLKL